MASTNNIAFCTYFDSNFLLRGLALHASLQKHNPRSRLFVLACDQKSLKILQSLSLLNTEIIRLEDIEDKKLLSVKKQRTRTEYLWTITPSLPLYVLKKQKGLDYICYLDADTFFFDSIKPILKEFNGNSIYITKHNYPKGTEVREYESGIYNVGFNLFKNDASGLQCLKDWRASCIDWCYAKPSEGKFGDQMYLNEWPNKYKGVQISDNTGVNTAPWNISQYTVRKKSGDVYINKTKLVLYHFHQLYFKDVDNAIFSRGYQMNNVVIKYIYTPYIEELKKQFDNVRKIDPTYEFPISSMPLSVQIRDFLVTKFGYPYWKGKTFLWKQRMISN